MRYLLTIAFFLAACGAQIPDTSNPDMLSDGDCDDADGGIGPRHCEARGPGLVKQGLTSPDWPGCYLNDLDSSDGYVNQYWDRSELGIGYASVMVPVSRAGEYDIVTQGTRQFWSHSTVHTPSTSYPSFFSNNVIVNTSPCFDYPGFGSVQWVKFLVWMCTSGSNCDHPVANGTTPPPFYSATQRKISVLDACGSVARMPNSPVVTQAQGGALYNAIPETYGGAMCQCTKDTIDCPSQW